MTVYNAYGHLGFELYPKGFRATWVGKWINTSVAHNQHHEKFNGNYGCIFCFGIGMEHLEQTMTSSLRCRLEKRRAF